MTNSLVGDHQVAVVDVDEGVLEGSDMFGTNLYGFLVTIDQLACRGTRLRLSTSMGDMTVEKVWIVDFLSFLTSLLYNKPCLKIS